MILAVVSVLVLVLGAMVFLLLRNDQRADEASGLVFQPVPARCSIDVCRDEGGAVQAQTDGFTPGGVVGVAIFVPS